MGRVITGNIERQIIERALDRVGLLSRKEALFIAKIARWPANWRLSPPQAAFLYDIGEKKLNLVFERPAPKEVIDYRARACA